MNYNKPIQSAPIPNTNPFPEPVEPRAISDVASSEPTACKKLYPARTEFFTNDLTPEAKEEIVKIVEDQTRAALSVPKVTVNAVSRMLGIEHNKVKRQCVLVSGSLATFFDTRDNVGSVAKIAQSISRLTPNEKQLLLNQLQRTE